MAKIIRQFWGLFYSVLFLCARVVLTMTRIRIRGTMVAVWHEKRVLIIKKSYRNLWSMPGGLVRRNETWVQGVVRETREEVGIRLNEEDLVLRHELPGELGPGDRMRLFEVKIVGPVEVAVDGREIIHAEFVSPEEALNRNLYEHVKQYLLTR